MPESKKKNTKVPHAILCLLASLIVAQSGAGLPLSSTLIMPMTLALLQSKGMIPLWRFLFGGSLLVVLPSQFPFGGFLLRSPLEVLLQCFPFGGFRFASSPLEVFL